MKKCVFFFCLILGIVGCYGPHVEVKPAEYGKVMSHEGYSEAFYDQPTSFLLPYSWRGTYHLVVIDGADHPIIEPMTVFMPEDKLTLEFEVRGTATVTPDKTRNETLFKKGDFVNDEKNDNIRKLPFTKVYKTYGEPVIRTTARAVVSQYSISEVLSNLENVSSEIESKVRVELKNTPIDLLRLNLAAVNPPKVVVMAQEAKKKREIEVEQANADKMVKLTEADAALEVAKKQQQVDLLEAETQVLVEKKLSESVNEAFVTQRMMKIYEAHAKNGKLLIVPTDLLRNPAGQFTLTQKILNKE